MIPHPEGVAEDRGTAVGVRTNCLLLSSGLRCAATTGYYLTAFLAEIRSPRFSPNLHRVFVLTTLRGY
jgi:hypothetical protein